MKYLQQSTSVLSSARNKMSVQESEKVKEKVIKNFEKEAMGSKKYLFLVFKGYMAMANILGQDSTQVQSEIG